MKKFKEMNIKSLNQNVFKLIGSDWMLITAGTKNKLNTMTASWGGLGVLWDKNVAFTFIRPQRYTFEFVENNDYYSLSFFNVMYKKELSFCGTNSGRDVNKLEQISFVPYFEEAAPCFEEARITLICKKLYGDFIKPEYFVDKSIDLNYENKDYHKMYIGEIIKVLAADE